MRRRHAGSRLSSRRTMSLGATAPGGLMSPRTGSAPTTLRTWLQEVVRSIPSRCVGTLLELLFGTMLTARGMISQAILAIAPRMAGLLLVRRACALLLDGACAVRHRRA